MPVAIKPFGVEVECIFPGMNRPTAFTADVLAAGGVTARSEDYNHAARDYWKVIYDASVEAGGYGGVEAVSPILNGEEGITQVGQAIDILGDAGFEVNQSCGLHVHIGDVDDLTVCKNVLKIYSLFEPGFDRFVTPFRRANKAAFARSNALPPGSEWFSQQYIEDLFQKVDRARNHEQIAKLFRDRGVKVNFAAYAKHKTIEFRQHQGTMNAKKAMYWVRLIQALWVAGTTEEPEVRYYKQEEVIPALLEKLAPDPEVAEYYTKVDALLNTKREEAIDLY